MSESEGLSTPSSFGLGLKVFLGAFLGLFSLVGASCLTCTGLAVASTASASGATPELVAQVQPVQPAQVQGPAVAVTARDLARAYGASEVSADAQYKDRRLEVTGALSSVLKGPDGALYVSLATSAAMPDVRCEFAPAQGSELASLTRGQSVTLVGTARGLMTAVHLEGCALGSDHAMARGAGDAGLRLPGSRTDG